MNRRKFHYYFKSVWTVSWTVKLWRFKSKQKQTQNKAQWPCCVIFVMLVPVTKMTIYYPWGQNCTLSRAWGNLGSMSELHKRGKSLAPNLDSCKDWPLDYPLLKSISSCCTLILTPSFKSFGRHFPFLHSSLCCKGGSGGEKQQWLWKLEGKAGLAYLYIY